MAKPYWECKVCSATPDDYGSVRHGRGCYMLSENGGGEEYIAECDLSAGGTKPLLNGGHYSYPHMCRDGHEQIGWAGDDEMCPVCRVQNESERLLDAFRDLFHYYDSGHIHPGLLTPCLECSKLERARSSIAKHVAKEITL